MTSLDKLTETFRDGALRHEEVPRMLKEAIRIVADHLNEGTTPVSLSLDLWGTNHGLIWVSGTGEHRVIGIEIDAFAVQIDDNWISLKGAGSLNTLGRTLLAVVTGKPVPASSVIFLDSAKEARRTT
jgi:hypothetical protein